MASPLMEEQWIPRSSFINDYFKSSLESGKNGKNDINAAARDALLDIIKEDLVAKSLIFKGILDDNQDAALRCGIICGTPSS